jgi:hypothetical protein
VVFAAKTSTHQNMGDIGELSKKKDRFIRWVAEAAPA